MEYLRGNRHNMCWISTTCNQPQTAGVHIPLLAAQQDNKRHMPCIGLSAALVAVIMWRSASQTQLLLLLLCRQIVVAALTVLLASLPSVPAGTSQGHM